MSDNDNAESPSGGQGGIMGEGKWDMNGEVIALNTGVLQQQADQEKPPLWERVLLTLGFMTPQGKSNINGTALTFFALFLAAVLWIAMDWNSAMIKRTITAAKEADNNDAMTRTAARRYEDKLNKETTKRAEFLQWTKEQGFYEKVPEKFKAFEFSEVDKQYVAEPQQNKEDK